jgi:hypothetical protein
MGNPNHLTFVSKGEILLLLLVRWMANEALPAIASAVTIFLCLNMILTRRK